MSENETACQSFWRRFDWDIPGYLIVGAVITTVLCSIVFSIRDGVMDGNAAEVAIAQSKPHECTQITVGGLPAVQCVWKEGEPGIVYVLSTSAERRP